MLPHCMVQASWLRDRVMQGAERHAHQPMYHSDSTPPHMLVRLQLWRGQFRQVMPSDLRQQGAFGYSSVPVAGPADQSAGRYAAGPQRSQLVAIFKRDGCHHCGGCWLACTSLLLLHLGSWILLLAGVGELFPGSAVFV